MSHAEMEAGRELDALVAERVMGLSVQWDYGRVPFYWHPATLAHGLEIGPDGLSAVRRPIKPYSTDISAAWLVVEKLRADGFYPEIHALTDGDWRCEIRASGEPIDVWEDAPTAPLAICRAALAAIATPSTAAGEETTDD